MNTFAFQNLIDELPARFRHQVSQQSFLLSLQPHSGILSMLDEECLRPGDVTDATFLAKLESVCGKHQHFESRRDSKFLADKSLPHEAFRIQHYAGKVREIVFRTFSFCSTWTVSSMHRQEFSTSRFLGFSTCSSHLQLRNACICCKKSDGVEMDLDKNAHIQFLTSAAETCCCHHKAQEA